MFLDLPVKLHDGRVGYLQPGRIVIKDGVIETIEKMSIVYRQPSVGESKGKAPMQSITNCVITPLICDENGEQMIVEGVFVEELKKAPKTKEDFFKELVDIGLDEESARKAAELSTYD